MRKSLGLTEHTQLLVISDSEEKKISLVPLQLAEDRVYIKIKINMPDTPGSLSDITNVFGELGFVHGLFRNYHRKEGISC